MKGRKSHIYGIEKSGTSRLSRKENYSGNKSNKFYKSITVNARDIVTEKKKDIHTKTKTKNKKRHTLRGMINFVSVARNYKKIQENPLT